MMRARLVDGGERLRLIALHFLPKRRTPGSRHCEPGALDEDGADYGSGVPSFEGPQPVAPAAVCLVMTEL